MANKSFSLFDFCKKRADKVQIFGEESLDEEGNVISFIDQAALVTHFLQLRHSKVDTPYAAKQKAFFICGMNSFVENVPNALMTL